MRSLRYRNDMQRIDIITRNNLVVNLFNHSPVVATARECILKKQRIKPPFGGLTLLLRAICGYILLVIHQISQ